MKRRMRSISFLLAFIMILTSVQVPALADELQATAEYIYDSETEDITYNDVSSEDVELEEIITEIQEPSEEKHDISSGETLPENDISENEISTEISGNDVTEDISENDFEEETPGEDTTCQNEEGNYTVSFVVEAGVVCEITSRDVSANEEIGELPTPVKTGYSFRHWYINNEEKTPVTAKTIVTSDIELNAQFVANEYKVTFDVRGGIPVSAKLVTYDLSYGDLPETTIAGGEFDGWYTEASGGEQVVTDTIVKTDSDHTLFAHWNYKYTTENPVFGIESGSEVKKGTRLIITSATSSAKIYYSLDGTEPEISEENRYREALILTEAVTVKAIAVREGYDSSEVVSSSYTIKDESAEWGDIREEDREAYEDADKVPESLWVVGVKDQVFTGSSITLSNLRVYFHKTLLIDRKDYTVKYSSNKNAGTATVTVNGRGNYSGSLKKTFQISPLSLGDPSGNDENVCAPDISKSYNKKTQKGTTTVTYFLSGKWVTLKAGTDFYYSYSKDFNYKSPGDYVVTIVGKGNYTGTATFTESIISSDSGKKLVTSLKYNSIGNIYADGTAKTPAITIKNSGVSFVEGIDYTLEYQNNIDPGTATIIVRGIGDYTGTKVLNFKIVTVSIGKATVEGITSQNYTGLETTQSAYVLTYKAGKNAEPETLVEGRDYTVSYSNNVNAGKKATIIFTGINRFGGTRKKTYIIDAKSLTDTDILPAEIGEVPYQKNGVSPLVSVVCDGKTLNKGTDYTVSYTNNKAKNDGTNVKKIPTVTIKGKGNYKGTFTRTFTISGSTLDNTRMIATDITYAAKAGICKPSITLYDSNNAKLSAGTDYDKNSITYVYVKDTMVTHIDKKKNVTYEIKAENTAVDMKNDVIPVGTEIRVTVIGKGNYEGSEKSTVFRFVEANISKAKVKINTQYYTGEAIELNKADITVKIGKKILAATDYEIVGYSNNVSKGTARVTLRGIGNYGGEKTVSFSIAAKSLYYTVKYDSNKAFMIENKPVTIYASGSMKNSTVAAGSKIASNTFKISGYSFTGWNTEPDGTGASYSNQERFSLKEYENGVMTYGSTVTLYAQWSATVFKITYSCGYSITAKENPSTYTIEDEFEFVDPDPGYYTFYGWYKDSKFRTQRTGIARETTGNITIYGKVTPYKYTIKFDANGADGYMSPMKDLACGNTYTLNACSYVKTNYYFIGWNTKKDGSGTTYANKKKVKNLCTTNGSSLTLYAQWEPYTEQKIWDTLMAEFGNPYGVAGLMGNLYVESGLRSNNLQNSYNTKLGLSDEEYTARVDNGSYTNFIHDSAGYGLAQWTYWSRKQNLYYYAKGNGKSIGDLGMQLEFLIQELRGYSEVYNTLCNASSVREASDAVLLKYEKPRNQGESVRQNRANISQSFYDKYAYGSSLPSGSFVVTVNISTLHIRSGPGTNYASKGYIATGDYTISQTAAGTGAVKGWGQLKDGRGWISLDYCIIHN